MVCDHPLQIIDLQRQIPDLQMKMFLHLQCDHTGLEQRIQTLPHKREEDRIRPAAPGTEEELRQELAEMTQAAQQSAEEVSGVRMQLANALMLAGRAALVAPQAQEGKGQEFPDSPDISELDYTRLIGWMSQLRMVIRHKPPSFPEEHSKMRYAFNRLR
jgi:hypothetical protein